MNAITHAQINSVSLELDNSNRSALDKLRVLCGEFDTLCQWGRRMSRTDKMFLTPVVPIPARLLAVSRALNFTSLRQGPLPQRPT